MSKGAFFALAVFCVLLFGGMLYLFFQPADLNGWILLFVMMMINPGIMLGILACDVDW